MSPCEPQGTASLPGEVGKFYAVLVHPRNCLNKEHVCHFTQPSDRSVHICWSLDQNYILLNSGFVLGYRRHLDQAASALLKYTQKAT